MPPRCSGLVGKQISCSPTLLDLRAPARLLGGWRWGRGSKRARRHRWLSLIQPSSRPLRVGPRLPGQSSGHRRTNGQTHRPARPGSEIQGKDPQRLPALHALLHLQQHVHATARGAIGARVGQSSKHCKKEATRQRTFGNPCVSRVASLPQPLPHDARACLRARARVRCGAARRCAAPCTHACASANAHAQRAEGGGACKGADVCGWVGVGGRALGGGGVVWCVCVCVLPLSQPIHPSIHPSVCDFFARLCSGAMARFPSSQVLPMMCHHALELFSFSP